MACMPHAFGQALRPDHDLGDELVPLAELAHHVGQFVEPGLVG